MTDPTLVERLRASVIYQYMPMAVRKMLSDAADHITTLEATLAAMPTIWDDPAGKGYPCFERPMTPQEARNHIAALEARITELEAERHDRD